MMRPAFHSWYRVELVEPDGVYLLSETAQHLLRGKVYRTLAPFLNGSHSVDELVDRFGDELGAAEIYFAVTTLETSGFLADGSDQSKPEAPYWTALGLDGTMTARRIAGAAVDVVAADAAIAGRFADM